VIADFIADRMSACLAGGMRPETAARFTRGELAAVYKGNHYSRDAYGAMRVTPPPEALGIAAARAKCDDALRKILGYLQKRPIQNTSDSAPVETEKKTGLEGLREYVNRGTI
jgi:hypothetical protein